MLFTAVDETHMARALTLAEQGMVGTSPNPRVGCVIVRDGVVVGEGYHASIGGPHAEVNALAEAGEQANCATIYVTLEPCAHFGKTPPCVDAVIAAKPSRVVVAMVDPNPKVAGQSIQRLRDLGIEVDVGLMAAEAEALNPGFAKRMRCGQPYVRCKMAMSLDGKTALASGESQWITGEAARADVQRWRARSDAIITGVGTVVADDPSMSARLPNQTHHPLRVIADSQLATPMTSKMLGLPGETVIATTSSADDFQVPDRVSVLRLPPDTNGQVNLAKLLDALVQRGCQEILLESGSVLAGRMLELELIDELVLYIAPTVLGTQAREAFVTKPLSTLADKFAFQYDSVERIGDDLRVIAKKHNQIKSAC